MANNILMKNSFCFIKYVHDCLKEKIIHISKKLRGPKKRFVLFLVRKQHFVKFSQEKVIKFYVFVQNPGQNIMRHSRVFQRNSYAPVCKMLHFFAVMLEYRENNICAVHMACRSPLKQK